MKIYVAKTWLAGLLVGFTGLWTQGEAVAAHEIQHVVRIYNKTGITANDLHLKFTGAVHDEVLFDSGAGKNRTPSAYGDDYATWGTGNCPTVPDGGSATLTYTGGDDVSIDWKSPSTYWTDNGKKIDAPVYLGRQPELLFRFDPSTGRFFGFAQFFNPEPVPVIYGDIQFFVNNDIANFGGDGFDMPTGQFVQGLPPQIMLPPGQSSGPLPLGPLDPSGYVLGLAIVVRVDNPREEYAVHTAAAPSAQATPIQLFGFNVDVISDQDPAMRFAHPFDANTFAWFESGAVDDNGVQHKDGLPAGLTFTSPTGSGARYQIQPANGFNVLQLAPGQIGTLTLVNPGDYKGLYFIASSGEGTPSSLGGGAINFADGSTQIFNFNVFDWSNGLGGLHPEAVLPVPTGRADAGSTGTGFFYNRDSDFQIYETVIPIDPWHAGVPILSIDFTGAPDAFYSNIFGVSGQ